MGFYCWTVQCFNKQSSIIMLCDWWIFTKEVEEERSLLAINYS